MIFEIIPSPGPQKEWEVLEERIKLVKPFAKTLHIDILDGKFAPNLTILDPQPFAPYTKDLLLEVHLMVEDPIQYVKPFADAGFRRFLGQIEKMPEQKEFIQEARKYGEGLLAIDGPTSLDALTISPEDTDGILIMSITAGFSGQSFVHEHMEKVKMIRSQSASFPIEVDGGITDKTIGYAKEAGANRFIATSFIYGATNPQEAFETLTQLINS